MEIKNLIKPTDNITLNSESANVFPLKSSKTQGWPLSPLLFNILLKVLVKVVKQQKGKKTKDI